MLRPLAIVSLLLLVPLASAAGTPSVPLFYNPGNPSGDGTAPTVPGTLPSTLDDLLGTNDGFLRNFGSGAGYVGSGTAADPYALRLDGTDDYIATSTQYGAQDVFSLSVWFKTTDASGLLIGFQGTQDGSTGYYDRLMYLSSGKLVFGTWTGFANTIQSTETVNDGQWHLATATMGATGSADGMKIYIDGQLAAESANTDKADYYDGYWRIGGGTVWGGVVYLQGDIGTVQIDGEVLTADEVQTLYASGQSPAQPLPELSTLVLFAVGLMGIVAVARRRRA